MSFELPKFDFSQSTIKTDEELAAAEAATGRKADKYLKPGSYEVVVAKIDEPKMNEKDPTWVNLKLTYADAGQREITDFLMVPTREITFGDKKILFPFKKLQKFCGAMGHTLTASNVGDVLKQVFGRIQKLEGQALKIDVGYTKAHVKWAGKSEDGSTMYHLIDRDGNPIRDADLQVVAFPDVEAARNYAEANKIALDRYASVLAYARSAAAQAPAAAASGW